MFRFITIGREHPTFQRSVAGERTREGQIILRLGEIGANPQGLVVMVNRRVIFARMAKQVSQFLVSKKQSRIDLETTFVSAPGLFVHMLGYQYSGRSTFRFRVFRIQRKRALVVCKGALLLSKIA
jgi:hypothetical protein